MKASYRNHLPHGIRAIAAIAILTAGACFAASATPAQQDQSNGNVVVPQQNQNQQDPYQQGPPPQQNTEAYPDQGYPSQQDQGQSYPGQPYPGQQDPGQYGNGQARPRPPYQNRPNRQSAAPVRPPAGPPPASLTVQSGTLVPIRVTQWLSSDRNVVGDSFSATLDQPLVVDGWVVARRGQTVMGRVAVAKKAGLVKGQSQLGLELNELTLVDGQPLAIQTQLIQSSGGTSNGRDAAAVGATTITGAAIGGIADGGAGAGIGAGAGAAAGIIGVLSTRGRATMIAPETLLTFRVDSQTSISTGNSQMAFQPVSQSDYEGDQDAYGDRRPRRAGPGPGYPPPAYGYPYPYPNYYGPYPYYGYYPGPVIGFYGAYGYGPRYYGRGFRRR